MSVRSRGVLVLALAAPIAASAQQSRPAKAPHDLEVKVSVRMRSFEEGDAADEAPAFEQLRVITAALKAEDDRGGRFRAVVATEQIEDERSTPSEQEAIVERAGGLWTMREGAEPSGPVALVLRALGAGGRTRALQPKGPAPRSGAAWPIERRQVEAIFEGLCMRFAEVPDIKGELRFVGPRDIDGVPCLAYAIRWSGRWFEADQGTRTAARLNAIIVVERDRSQARLINLTEVIELEDADEEARARTWILKARARIDPAAKKS